MAVPRLLTAAFAVFMTGVYGDCNPLTTNSCPIIPGLAIPSYTIDFTKQDVIPPDWILADAANVTFGIKGAQFNFNKRKDAPYIWTNFYVGYGQIDVEMEVANGTGIITSAVMFSDDADEIDWEFSGSNFGAGASHGKAQTNVFGKGITGNYDRGTQQDLSPPPQTGFHTYTINWTPDKIDWIIDGTTTYTTTNNGQATGNYQFPQTPSRLHLGIWDAGDPDTAAGTRNWAGGYTDYSKLPYVAYVRKVKITTPYPCKWWKFPNGFTGSWKDVQCTSQTTSTSMLPVSTLSSAKPAYTSMTYVVQANDTGNSIADKLGCMFAQLSSANPGVNWDLLLVGQSLNNPKATSSGNVVSPSSASFAVDRTTASIMSSEISSSQSSSLTFDKSIGSSLASGASTLNNSQTMQSSTVSKASASGLSISAIKPNKATITAARQTTQSSPASSLLNTSAMSVVCTQDDCFNSMTADRLNGTVLDFCTELAKTSQTATPSYFSGCRGVSSRIASACSCLCNTSPGSSPSSAMVDSVSAITTAATGPKDTSTVSLSSSSSFHSSFSDLKATSSTGGVFGNFMNNFGGGSNPFGGFTRNGNTQSSKYGNDKDNSGGQSNPRNSWKRTLNEHRHRSVFGFGRFGFGH